MSFLLDSNCWMQMIRAREHAMEVRDLLRAVPSNDIALTDFALHSLGLVMGRHRILDQFPRFVDETLIRKSVRIVSILPQDLHRVVEQCNTNRLDFDDAYQYVAAELNDLTLVSLDADFDRTPRGRLTPAAALQRYRDDTTNQG
jgi:predicted nucleic acid-binding protein